MAQITPAETLFESLQTLFRIMPGCRVVVIPDPNGVPFISAAYYDPSDLSEPGEGEVAVPINTAAVTQAIHDRNNPPPNYFG